MQEPRKSLDILEDHLNHVRKQLQKHRVVESMVHEPDPGKHVLIESLVHRQNLADLCNRLARLHIADVAYIVENLDPAERAMAWEQLSEQRRGEVLLEASESVRQQLLTTMPRERLLAVLRKLDPDDLAYLADDLSEDVLKECLQSLSADERAQLETSLVYAEDSVGALMSRAMTTAHDTDTTEQTLTQLRALDEWPTQTDKLFVVDRRGVFRGVLSLETLLRANPQASVADIMATDVVVFSPDDDAHDVAQAFERYNLVSAPVLNERGKLAGRLTVDVMMDYLRQQRSDELLKLAGLSREEDMFSSIWSGARNRWVWLSLNLVTAFVASRVIGAFEGTISQLVALAALMPIVASVGGNTGNQTTALVVRAIAMGQATTQNVLRLVRREIGISVVNGVLLGVVAALFAMLLYHNIALGLVIAGAMLANLMIAAVIGLAVPLILEHFGKDPALGSSVLLTATTDSMGFFIFLGMATVFLL